MTYLGRRERNPPGDAFARGFVGYPRSMATPFKPITELTDPAQKEIVREALLLRGTIITSYAHAEFLLAADIGMRCWTRSAHKHLGGGPFPYSVEKRD